MESRVCIECDHPRHRVTHHSLLEEAFGRDNIASFAQQEVHRSTLLIHGSIQVRPETLHLYVRFVAAPGAADRPSEEIPALFKLRNVTLHPTKNCRVRQPNASLVHHLDQIAGAQFKAEVPANAQHDNLTVEMSSLE